MKRISGTTRKCLRLAAGVVAMLAGVCSGRAAGQPVANASGNVVDSASAYVFSETAPSKGILTADDEKFLDDLERRGIQFFLDSADPETGLLPDRAKANGGAGDVASVAAVGFGLTAFCIADERGWVSHQEAYDRSLRVLKFLRDKAPQEHGLFYHFLDMRTGERAWKCEVSNIDTALLMAGVLTVRQHFPGTELSTLANELYERVEWPWMVRPDGRLSMGWHPETGFIDSYWDSFSEGPLIFLMAMGSRTHPLPPQAWKSWKREPVAQYGGMTFVQCPPLFTHQFPQCWFDLRGLRDASLDFYRNAQLAVRAQQEWCAKDLSKRFPIYADLWGISASDSAKGYQGNWGGPPEDGQIDGSLVPYAVAGSLAFEPRICMDALKTMHARYGEKAYLKYGFVDAFNPANNWFNPDVLGIDVGPTVLMAENCRSGFVWRTFMSSPEATAALKAAGFRPLDPKQNTSSMTSIYLHAPSDDSHGRE